MAEGPVHCGAKRDRRIPPRLGLAILAALAGILAGCSSAPPPTLVEITFIAGPDANPDAAGRPSPITLRYYQLAGTGTFAKADYFQIYDKEGALLGPDLLDRQEVALKPGATQQIAFEAKPGAKFLGFIAAYRDIDHAQWRANAPIAAGAKTKLKVQLERLKLSVAPDAK